MKRTQTKVLSILLSLALLCSLAVPTAFAADSRYTDTTDHWAETAIERWSDYGIIEGYGDAFNPDNSITRGQMATILSKTLELTEEAENPFTDISADDWYAPYVLRCYKAGIMLGDNGKANPDAEITRQEAMTMFCRAFGIKADETADLTAFKDSGAIADWALPYVSALINSGIVSGVSSDMIAPADSMSRASLVTILDRAVVQYINTSGEYSLTDKEGIILVTAGDTTLKGETKADILISQATDGKAVTFKDASVTGAVTVQADTKIITDNAKLPEIEATIEDITVIEDKKSSTTRRPSGGSSGGSSRPTISNLTISEEKAITSGTYNNVTITDAVADGEVTLSNITINGDLTIKGGGSSSIKLNNCTIQGKVIMAKETGEAPRLALTNTPIATVEVQKPAIIEAADTTSAVTKVEATANIEIKGENTKVDTLSVPETAESAVAVTVTAGNVATVEAKAETSVTGASNSVDTIVATAAVTADSEAVQKVEIPETATESVSVTVTGDEAVDVEINSTSGASVTGANVTVSTTLETTPDNITVGGEVVTHIHKWGEPSTIPATCEQDGETVYTCIADNCGDTAKTKTEVITKLGHSYGDWKKSDDDLHVRECANDKDHYEKAEHTWDNGTITTEATCGHEGVKTYTCSVCKGTKTEEIDEIAHDWSDWVKVDTTNHKRVCKNDASHTETEDHTLIIDNAESATCTETGKTEGSHCDICKSVIVEQTTTPALKHDFTGKYETDEDGHWHKCARENCEETDTKAGHTYDTTNCEEIATCTVCEYEKPAGEHTWSDWEKVDEENHKHTCSCTATETESHKWNDGEITTEPTEEKEGVKTFTCTDCGATKTEVVPVVSAKNIWLELDGNNLYLKFNDDAELGTDEGYFLYENGNEITTDTVKAMELFWLIAGGTVDRTFSYEIKKGNWEEKSTLHSLENAVNVTVTQNIPEITIQPQADGTYKFVSSENKGYFYRIKAPNGTAICTGYTADGTILCGIYEGCTIEVQTCVVTIATDALSANITTSSTVTIDSPSLCTALGTVVEVDTADELVDAVNRGAIATLTTNITTNKTIAFKTGAPATINLNGYVIDSPYISIYYGKTLNIIGTTAGSGVINSNGTNTITALTTSALNIEGGTYEKIAGYGARSVTLKNISAIAEDNTIQMQNVPELSINGGTYTATQTGDNNNIVGGIAITLRNCSNATIDGITTNGNYYAIDVYNSANVNVGNSIINGLKSGLRCNNQTSMLLENVEIDSTSAALSSNNNSTITVNSGTFTSADYIISMSSSGTININGGNFKATGDDSYIIWTNGNTNNLVISAGEFTNVTKVFQSDNENRIPSYTITGGTYDIDMTNYLADGYICTNNGDGTYTVAKIETE